MLVEVAAYTSVDYGVLEDAGYIPHWKRLEVTEPDAITIYPEGWAPNQDWKEWAKEAHPSELDDLAEVAGRECYQSFHRPRAETASNRDYLKNIIDSEHFSVLGHAHVTFHVSGVSRALLLELERHSQRYNLNFSVLSQRYVDQNKVGVVVPPLFDAVEAVTLRAHFEQSLEKYDRTFHDMRERGASVKEARGAARAFLPEATETRFFVTASVRGWRAVVKQRATEAADAEIRRFALEVLRKLQDVAPNSVQDLTGELLSSSVA